MKLNSGIKNRVVFIGIKIVLLIVVLTYLGLWRFTSIYLFNLRYCLF